MKVINFKVTDRLKVLSVLDGNNTISSGNPIKIAAGNYKSVIFNFTFDEKSWSQDELKLTKYATFKINEEKKIQSELQEIDNYKYACYLPYSVSKKPCKINIGVYASKGENDSVEKVVSSENIYFLIVDGAFSKDIPMNDETPMNVVGIKQEIDSYAKEKINEFNTNYDDKTSEINVNEETRKNNENERIANEKTRQDTYTSIVNDVNSLKENVQTNKTNIEANTTDIENLKTSVDSNKESITNINNTLSSKADSSSIPTKLSNLTNDTGYITKDVDNLDNYYKKNETYTQSEVKELISVIPKFNMEVVNVLPTENISSTTMYLLKNNDNTYTEYIYINDNWEELNTPEIDLSNYYTITNVDNLLSNKVDKENGKTLTSNDFTDEDKTQIDTNKNDIATLKTNKLETSNILSGSNIKVQVDGNNVIINSTNESGEVAGDMTKAIYDTDSDGIVDNAAKVNNHTVLSDVPENAIFTDTVYDDTTIKNDIASINKTLSSKADSSSIPDTANFVTVDVNNLTNYTTTEDLNTKLDSKANSKDLDTINTNITNLQTSKQDVLTTGEGLKLEGNVLSLDLASADESYY